MRTLSRLSLVFALVGGLAWSAGCGESGTDPLSGTGTIEETPNLTEEFGGYTATGEAPAFGDAELEATAALEVEVEDAMADDDAVRGLENDPRSSIYALTVTWGMLDDAATDLASSEGDDTGDLGDEVQTTDWAGSLEVTDGAIVLRRVVAFERTDHVVRPRESRQVLEWESLTGPHYDGIRVLVYAPPPSDEAPDVEPALIFSTGPLTQRFALSELADLNELVEVDDLGNRVHFLAEKTNADAYARGWLFGEWKWGDRPADEDAGEVGDSGDENAELGFFRGRWVSARGGVVGFLRGHFGVTEAGEQVFFGKYIDRSGNFQGFLRGTWAIEEGQAEDGSGTFRGAWHSSRGVAQGELRGTWVTSPRGGLFNGKWVASVPTP